MKRRHRLSVDLVLDTPRELESTGRLTAIDPAGATFGVIGMILCLQRATARTDAYRRTRRPTRWLRSRCAT